jgi:ADP-ribose pyrophosphatase
MTRETLYNGNFLTLYRLDGRYEVVEHGAAVCVLAIDGERVLGVRQFRPAIGEETWELPAGLVDAGETPEAAAARELAEEAQLGGRLRLLSQFYTSPGFTNEKLYVYEASEVVEREGRTDEGEDIRIEWRDLAEIWRQVASGELNTSAPSALALAYALGRAGKL